MYLDRPENKKLVPESKNLINKNAGNRKSKLTRISAGSFYGSIIDKDTSENLNTFNYSPSDNVKYEIPQEILSFDLWITEVNFGYGITGQNASSRFYNKFYAQYFKKAPLQIKGICKDEAEYNDLATFIREQQVNATLDHNNLFHLQIPGGGIKAIGIIPNFVGGVTTSNNGIPVAPEFQFEFIVLRDLTDPSDSRVIKGAYQTSSFIGNAQRMQIINDGASYPAIFSVSGGDVSPFNLSKYKSPPGTRRANTQEDINNGTNGAKGS